ncbi:MAG TPA: L-threonylcarbamoyladenylate synthase [Saprospiraceae bacterium]|mgnify:FL=1|nr:L-threonylcarbamoyladenylate synthase [Saprospiraceae bacterium]HRK80211.1 L-threonylcarbamoyladenylate synthase [Saprospiraceae bacterium]
MILTIHPQNPDQRKIAQVAEMLRKHGVVIYPTDTVYAIGCDMMSKEAVERLCRIRHLDPQKAMLTLICKDLSQVAEYAAQIDTPVFKLMRRNLPGPFTFILPAGSKTPKLFINRKKTIGVRIPDNAILMALVEELGHPILTASLKTNDDVVEYFTDPEDLHDQYENLVDAVIDGGPGGIVPSGLIDCTGQEPELIREGAGELKW